MDLFFQGATLINIDRDQPKAAGSVRVVDGRIAEILAPDTPAPASSTVVNLSGKWLMPGFVQTHTHLVQTLFRGLADDRPLLDWLRDRIWPLECAHDEESVYWSTRLGLTEMLLGGTTAILDMATVHHTDSVFHAAQESGMHATIGKAMMDLDNEAGLSETRADSISSSCALRDRWHGQGRLRYGFAPRFIPSCSKELLEQTRDAARETQCLIHTHASENEGELELVRQMTGKDNLVALDDMGLTGPDVVLAHCIHLNQREQDILARSGTTVAHCPSSNLKLGSGIARIPELRAAGVRCTLGADGAPCNNRMDMFTEMRLAALVQAPRCGPGALSADDVLEMATREGADALGLNTGRIAVGCAADLVAIDPAVIHGWGGGPPAGALAYALSPAAVHAVWIDGEQRVRDGAVIGWDTAETVRGCDTALKRVLDQAGI